MLSTSSHPPTHRHRLAYFQLGQRRCRIPIVLLFGQHGPDRTRHLIGKRHRDEHPRLASHHPGKPRALSSSLSRRPAHNRHRPDDQKPADVALTHLRSVTKPLLAARRVLYRHEPEPGGEVASALEGCHGGRERLNGHRRDRTHPWHGLQACRRRAFRLAPERSVQGRDLLAQSLDLLKVKEAEVADDR